MANRTYDYVTKYNKEKYKLYQSRVKKDDYETIEKLDNIPNRNAYICKLIYDDMHPDILSIKEIKNKNKPVINKYNIDDVYLFGSYARGEATKNSDIDIYCSPGNLKTLYDELDLIEELENALGKKVDLVTIGSQMDDYFKNQLEEDKIKIF